LISKAFFDPSIFRKIIAFLNLMSSFYDELMKN
jgi:hypothetical protein